MRLEMLAKDGNSGDQGCPSCYLGDDMKVYVQAEEASPAAYDAAVNLLPDELIVCLDARVILDAADRLRARA
ncbi:MAG: hypothetical protein ACRDS9_24740 [Pseudonocardiaceae bacterium]